jgi:nucleoside 2-deoxyribosyltransferase
MRMPVVYVAGPFRSVNKDTGKSDAWGVQQNVMRAMALSLEVWKRGGVGLCPHSNTMFFQDAHGCEDRVWLDGDIELLKRSDAILMTEDYERSSGARAELEFALKHGIPALYSVADLETFLADYREREQTADLL